MSLCVRADKSNVCLTIYLGCHQTPVHQHAPTHTPTPTHASILRVHVCHMVLGQMFHCGSTEGSGAFCLLSFGGRPRLFGCGWVAAIASAVRLAPKLLLQPSPACVSRPLIPREDNDGTVLAWFAYTMTKLTFFSNKSTVSK